MKSVPDEQVWFEVWYNRELGLGVGRHMRADTETGAHSIAAMFAAEKQPNIEVLKVTVTREPIKPKRSRK